MLVVLRGLALAKEYTRRYGKTHRCELLLRDYKTCPPDFESATPPQYSCTTKFGQYGSFRVPLCMPDQFCNDNACIAYCQYYLHKLIEQPKVRKWNRQDTFGLPLAIRIARNAA